MSQWFEDIKIGRPFQLGTHTFAAHEIIRFAQQYDPQYFHLGEDDAKHSHFGGLIASGWHTVVIGHRFMVDALFDDDEAHRQRGEKPGVSGPSPGVNRMDFKAPVRPGDTVSYTLTVANKRPSKSLPGWGLLFNEIDAVNQHGDAVYHAELVGFTKMRDFRMPLKLRLLTALTRVPGLGKVLRRGA